MSKLPHDWRLVPIEQILLPKEGLRRGPFGGALKKNIFVERGYKVYEQGNVLKKDMNIGRYYITEEKFQEMKAFEITPGDFLVTCSGSVGQMIQVPTYIEPGVINQALLRLRLNPDIVVPSFFEQEFSSKLIQDVIIDNTQGGAIPNLVGMELFRKIPFYLPPLPEQRKIAAILSTWDEAVALTERLIAALRQRKQALMQMLLSGEVRFKEFEGEEWDHSNLKELVEINYGKSPNNIQDNQGRFPIYGTSGIVGKTQTALCDQPAVIIGRKGTINKPYLVIEPFWAIDTTFYCVLKTQSDIRWLYYALIRQKLETYNEGSTLPSLSRNTIYDIPISIPPSSEQIRIADVLTVCDHELEQTVLVQKALLEQKRGLMQQLLTGAIRVQVDE